jgi:hypothetical protein
MRVFNTLRPILVIASDAKQSIERQVESWMASRRLQ